MKLYDYLVNYAPDVNGYIVLRKRYPISDGSEILTEQPARIWVKVPEVIPDGYVYNTPRAAAMALVRWIEVDPLSKGVS